MSLLNEELKASLLAFAEAAKSKTEDSDDESNAEVDSDIKGKKCQCCDNVIEDDGCGCDEDCKTCGGMGKPYEEKGDHQNEAKKLDPVGKADADIDNDGDVDSSDDYLKNRRKKIGKSIDAKKLKEMAKASKRPTPN